MVYNVLGLLKLLYLCFNSIIVVLNWGSTAGFSQIFTVVNRCLAPTYRLHFEWFILGNWLKSLQFSIWFKDRKERLNQTWRKVKRILWLNNGESLPVKGALNDIESVIRTKVGICRFISRLPLQIFSEVKDHNCQKDPTRVVLKIKYFLPPHSPLIKFLLTNY